MNLVDIELQLVERVKAVLGSKVRGVQSLPGDWDDDMLRRFAAIVPGVYVAFLGGGRRAAGGTEATIDARFSLYVCTGHPTELARRHGDAQQVGAYHLITALVPALHGLVVPRVGSLDLDDVQNLFTGSVERQALTVYALTFRLPLTFDATAPDELLAPFETFDAHWDIPLFASTDTRAAWLQNPPVGAADAHDVVTLPKP